MRTPFMDWLGERSDGLELSELVGGAESRIPSMGVAPSKTRRAIFPNRL